MNFLKNISLKKGDYIVCVTKDWYKFTYGKLYVVEEDKGPNSDLVDVANNDGGRYRPCYYGPDGNYFVTLKEWRQIQINKIINII